MPRHRDPSTSAFINALLREWTDWRVESDGDERYIVFDLPAAALSILTPLYGDLGPGRWSLGRPIVTSSDEQERTLSVTQLAQLVLSEPKIIASLCGQAVSSAARERFIARVADSDRNMRTTLRLREPELDSIFSEELGFIEAEQALLLGHSVHPTPRSVHCELRDDVSAFVPSHGGRVALLWFAIRRDRLHLRGSAFDGDHSPLTEECPARPDLDSSFLRLPLHPLQAQALAEPLAEAQRLGHVQPLGAGPEQWAPTSSMRTLARHDSAVMLKFSLPVRLTNSMRTLRIEELDRGLTVNTNLEQTEARALEQEFPWFRILRESAYYGLLGNDGEPLAESFVSIREDPFEVGQTAEVLATLLQDDPRTGQSRLATRLRTGARAAGECAVARTCAWWSRFIARVCRPLLVAQADYGLLLSAHQQNLVLELHGTDIERVWFRDTQGTAYSPLAQERFGDTVPQVAEACFTPPHDSRLFAYSTIINGVFNVIASLAMVPGVRKAWLLQHLRAELQWLRARPVRDPSCLDYLLHSEQLWAKGNFACCLRELDEATLTSPQDIYYPQPNPLKVVSAVDIPSPAIVTDPRRTVAAADIDGDIFLNLEGPEVAGTGELRQRGVIDGDEFRLEHDGGEHVSVAWTCAPSERSIVHLSDHVFGSILGVECLTHQHATATDPCVITRESMLQRAWPWHHRGTAAVPPTSRVESSGVQHPARTSTPPGLLYRRRCAAIDRVFCLRRFELDLHLDLFVQWMNDPVVAQFWEQAWDRERLAQYATMRLHDPHSVPMIGYFDDTPFAYFESYWAREDRLGAHYEAGDHDRGFHMAVGDPQFRFRGYGRHWFLSMAHFLFLDAPQTEQLVGEPRLDQARVRGWAKSTPWKARHAIEFPHKRAVLMTLSRDDFFAGFGSAR